MLRPTRYREVVPTACHNDPGFDTLETSIFCIPTALHPSCGNGWLVGIQLADELLEEGKDLFCFDVVLA